MLWSAAAVAGLGLLIRSFEQFFVFWPDRRLRCTPGDRGLPFEDVSLCVEAGIRIRGWFVPRPNPRGLLLYLEGNGGNRADRVGFLELAYTLGLSSLIVDYEGYADSQGKPSEAAVYRDARAALNWIRQDSRTRGLPLVLWGESLGGAVAIELASSAPPRGLIVASSFSSMGDMIDKVCLGLPVSRICRSQYRSTEKITRYQGPLLVLHGTADRFIPIAHGRKLYEAAPGPKEFYEIAGAGHECGQVLACIQANYRSALEKFLDHVLQ